MMYPLEDQFNGERGGRLRATFGQQCLMSPAHRDIWAEEMARGAAGPLQPATTESTRPHLADGYPP